MAIDQSRENQGSGSKLAKLDLIKRYPNRKLYDLKKSRYVTLTEIAATVRAGRDVKIIDNRTGVDITAWILTQIIFEVEKAMEVAAPVQTLSEIIRSGNGSFSSYLSKLDVFPETQMTVQPDFKEMGKQISRQERELSQAAAVSPVAQKFLKGGERGSTMIDDSATTWLPASSRDAKS